MPMSRAKEAFENLVQLSICVEIDPDEGCVRALVNIASGIILQLPKPNGFSMWGNSNIVPKNADCLILGDMPKRGEKDVKARFLANGDLQKLEMVWARQAAALGGIRQ